MIKSTLWAILTLFKLLFSFNHLKSKYAAASIPFEEAVRSGIIAHTEHLNLDVEEELYRDTPKVMGLFTIMDQLRRKKTKTTITSLFEERRAPDVLDMSAGYTSSASAGLASTITVGTTLVKHCYKNMTVKLLSSISSASFTAEGYIEADPNIGAGTISVKPIDVTKRFGKAAGSQDATRLLILGNWNPELAEATQHPTVLPNKVTNNTQTIRDNYTISTEAELERVYTVDEIVRAKDQAQFRHMRNIYMSLLFNGSSYRTNQTVSSATVQQNYMGGIEKNLLTSGRNQEYTTNNEVYSSFQTYQFNLFDLLLAGGGDKRLAVSNKATKKFFTDNKKDKGWYIFNNDMYMDTFGIPGVKTVETDQGQFDLLVDGFVDRVYPNIDEPYIMSLHLRYVLLKDMLKTQIRTNIQNNSVLGRRDEWVTIFTNLMALAESGGVWRKAYA